MRLQFADPVGPPAPRQRCRSPPTSTTGTSRTCTACSACTVTSCASSSSARAPTGRPTSSRSCPTTSPSASTACCAGLVEDRLPTAIVVGVVTERTGDRDGLLITRHLDYSLPYRTLLSGRGLSIPYLGDRLLDALVGLLVRLHLAGFFWGDCSLSNALFRRDAGALQAYIIDVETSERYASLTDGQRQMDLDIATENVAGGLLDLQAGGRLVEDIDPFEIATQHRGPLRQPVVRADRHRRSSHRRRCGRSSSACAACTSWASTSARWRSSPTRRVSACASCHASSRAGTTRTGSFALTGLWAGENQARRLLDDIRGFGAELQARTGTSPPENIAAVRWLDRRFEPIIGAIPPSLIGKLQAAEIYHQLLEHRWFECERQGREVSLEEALETYIPDVLGTGARRAHGARPTDGRAVPR